MKRTVIISFLVILVFTHLCQVGNAGTDSAIPLERLSHLIIAKARINGSQDEYNFVIDTGAVTFLDKSLAEEFGLKQKGMMAKIDSLQMAGFLIEKVFCFTTFDFRHFDALGKPIHGIIGSNLMERFRVIIDFGAPSITFSSDSASLKPPEGALLLPFRNHPVNNAPIVEFSLEGDKVEGMIDTGQPYPLVFPLTCFTEYESLYVQDYIVSKGLMEEWPMTSADHNYLARLKSLRFGDTEMDSVLCLFGELPAPLSMPLIGNDFLSQFRLVIDYTNDRILMIPTDGIYLESDMLSAGLRPDLAEDGDVVVKGIWEGSPADNAGIELGDRILSFSGRKISSANLIDLIDLLEDDETESVTLVIERESGAEEVSLTKTMLLRAHP